MTVEVEVQQGALPVTVIELIADVPAKGPKLLPLLERKMKTSRDKTDGLNCV